jgi:hypothetical protein
VFRCTGSASSASRTVGMRIISSTPYSTNTSINPTSNKGQSHDTRHHHYQPCRSASPAVMSPLVVIVCSLTLPLCWCGCVCVPLSFVSYLRSDSQFHLDVFAWLALLLMNGVWLTRSSLLFTLVPLTFSLYLLARNFTELFNAIPVLNEVQRKRRQQNNTTPTHTAGQDGTHKTT